MRQEKSAYARIKRQLKGLKGAVKLLKKALSDRESFKAILLKITLIKESENLKPNGLFLKKKKIKKSHIKLSV
ncbi:hypothetical protein HPHPA26_0578 [Helicobacter pylori Hp A-26]|uniref:Uncharacterized protein n=1 Tax=Helicobacter pylori Hp A-26 TaxID=992056 RepID=J0MR96_HELPX|nr:hypothetical protein HPHPA26_0578 [Helicobacter pylori Hp A-26]